MNPEPLPARHILTIEDQSHRHTIILQESVYSVGRHPDNAITLNSKKASRRHATLMLKQDDQTQRASYWILDGDLKGHPSHNGIFINGKRCSVHELQNGDLINFGCEINASYQILKTLGEVTDKKEAFPTQEEEDSTFILADAVKSAEDSFSDALISLDIEGEDTHQSQAYNDTLTQLPNRSLFREYLSMSLANARQNQSYMAIFWLNIANFGEVNDKLGYDSGNYLLKEFAQRLNASVRSGDIVARWGGDEFTLLFPQVEDLDDIPKMRQRLLDILEKPFKIAKKDITLPVYLGTACYPEDGTEAKQLLDRASTDLKNRQQQQNTLHPDITLTPQIQRSSLPKIDKRLWEALDKQELSIVYQPEINTSTGNVEVLEALVRWKHPEKGLISAQRLMPLVEKAESTIPIYQWVIQEIIKQVQEWEKMSLDPVIIAVNLSHREFYDAHLVSNLSNLLENSDLPPHLLEIEVTEKTVLKEMNAAHRIFHQLQQLGVSLAMDDFGTGISAIGYLPQFSFNTIKIGQSFTAKLSDSPQEGAVIAAIMALAQTLQWRVVAEGIETPQQMSVLHRYHCMRMQGYYLSPPLSGKEATQLLRNSDSSF